MSADPSPDPPRRTPHPADVAEADEPPGAGVVRLLQILAGLMLVLGLLGAVVLYIRASGEPPGIALAAAAAVGGGSVVLAAFLVGFAVNLRLLRRIERALQRR